MKANKTTFEQYLTLKRQTDGKWKQGEAAKHTVQAANDMQSRAVVLVRLEFSNDRNRGDRMIPALTTGCEIAN